MKGNVVYCDTPAGRIGISEEDGRITGLFFAKDKTDECAAQNETPVLKEAVRQLREYFGGKRRRFELPLAPEGTPFMRRVWDALLTIPYGETRSYKEIAALVGNEKACRAVGLANNKNPIPVIIPCHRVIGANGGLVGYGGGLGIKTLLLELEKKNGGL
jgi:methylated-DNA-[protein]-cysteine S-methyltransferase